jgi:holo-[acyl-carrier protein] synthase
LPVQVGSAESVAARLAAKKRSTSTAGKSGGPRIGWREIEVVRDEDGRPEVALAGLAAERAAALGVRRVMVSLSHTHQAAVAVAVLDTES